MNEKIIDKPLLLKVRNREEVIYDGEVDSLTSVNEAGKFDILRKHANFISLIKDYIIIRDLKGTKREIKIGQGIMKILDNKVNIYLGIKWDFKTDQTISARIAGNSAPNPANIR